MTYEMIIREYYRILEQRDYRALMQLFSKNATIVHPIFDTLPAADFFKLLFDRAQSHKITILTMFQAIEQPNRMATYLKAQFVTKNHTTFEEDGIHIYDFSTDKLIEKITVVIDTCPFRSEYVE